MHKALINDLLPGDRLGKTLYNDAGRILLTRGVELSPRFVRAIENRGFYAVYVMDGVADEILPLDVLSDRLYAETVGTVRGLYETLGALVAPLRPEIERDGAAAIQDLDLSSVPKLQKTLEHFDRIVSRLVEELANQDTLARVASLKTVQNPLYEHAVDVAIYAVLLGRRLGMKRTSIRDLALGCLLHDVGKVLCTDVNGESEDDPFDDEHNALDQHALLGFRLVRQLPGMNPRSPHVVLQHHERQDGMGLPFGKYGANRLFRSEQERFDPQRIPLLAEVAAIADVYANLSADRPDRSTLPIDVVRLRMDGLAGSRLNRDVMEAFFRHLQHYPVGTRLRLTGGRLDGCISVVVETNSATPDRPVVQVVFDRGGFAVTGVVEIDTRHLPPEVGLQVDAPHAVNTGEEPIPHWVDSDAPRLLLAS